MIKQEPGGELCPRLRIYSMALIKCVKWRSMVRLELRSSSSMTGVVWVWMWNVPTNKVSVVSEIQQECWARKSFARDWPGQRLKLWLVTKMPIPSHPRLPDHEHKPPLTLTVSLECYRPNLTLRSMYLFFKKNKCRVVIGVGTAGDVGTFQIIRILDKERERELRH